jgi:hypothetical protein
MARRRLVRSLQDGFGLMLRNATRHRRARDEPLAWPRKRPDCGRAERGAVTAVVAHRVSHVVCRRHWPAHACAGRDAGLVLFHEQNQDRAGRQIIITIIAVERRFARNKRARVIWRIVISCCLITRQCQPTAVIGSHR